MGLDNFRAKTESKHKAYGDHLYDDKLERWENEFSERFPIDLDIEFIEVSTGMSKTWAKATYKPDGTCFIRISEQFINDHADKYIKLTLLHEMCHVYFYRQGYKDTNHDKFFRWVVGHVGGDLTYTNYSNKKWQECIEPFLEMED